MEYVVRCACLDYVRVGSAAVDGILSMSVHTNATDFGAHTDQQSERDYILGVRVLQRNADI